MISSHAEGGKARVAAAVPKAVAETAGDREVILEGRGIGV